MSGRPGGVFFLPGQCLFRLSGGVGLAGRCFFSLDSVVRLSGGVRLAGRRCPRIGAAMLGPTILNEKWNENVFLFRLSGGVGLAGRCFFFA